MSKNGFISALCYNELPYLLDVQDFSEYASTGRAVREIFVMCHCCSMSLKAILLLQRGSAEGVTLFCVLIEQLS